MIYQYKDLSDMFSRGRHNCLQQGQMSVDKVIKMGKNLIKENRAPNLVSTSNKRLWLLHQSQHPNGNFPVASLTSSGISQYGSN